MAKLSVQEIFKNFDKHPALVNVSFDVPEKSIFGLLGPNGAGKTTLIRIINLITIPDKGVVMLDDKPINSNDIGVIGYLPEERGLYKKMKVGEQALYLAQLKGVPYREAKKKLKYWFEKFDIDSWWNRKVEELSKGMQQKIQFIVTVLHDPELLIFDEPFSGFDPINVNLLKDEILNLRDRGATVIFSTHNMASVEELCDEIVLINNGRKVLSGEIHDVKKQFKTDVFELSYYADKKLSLDTNYFEIVDSAKERDISIVHIKILQDKYSSNALLRKAVEQVEVVSYREVLPSLNDIFIQKVNGSLN